VDVSPFSWVLVDWLAGLGARGESCFCCCLAGMVVKGRGGERDGDGQVVMWLWRT